MYDHPAVRPPPPEHLVDNGIPRLACKQARAVLPTLPARASRTAARSRRPLLAAPLLPPTTSARSLLSTESPSSVSATPANGLSVSASDALS
jgi:hypothetical protein